jgi:hypothetical protein
LHRRGELLRARSACWFRRLGRPGRIGDRRDDAVLELGWWLRPHLVGLEQPSQLIELGALFGRQRLDRLAGQIRDPVLVASAQHSSYRWGVQPRGGPGL